MRMKRSMALECLIVLLACDAFGQSVGTPEFEVADVRVNKLDQAPSAEFSKSGQITLRGITMKMLIGLGWKESQLLPEVTALTISLNPSVAQFRPAEYLKG